MLNKILIVEDNDLERGLYSRILKSEGYMVAEVPDLKAAKHYVELHSVDIVVLDVNLPDGNGLDFISELRAKSANLEIIVFTSRGTIDDGVKSIKLGASDYMVKGDSPIKLIAMIENARKVLSDRVQAQPTVPPKKHHGFDTIIGNSSAIEKAKEMARKVASTNANVLLLGETGVGKDLFAEAIHYASARRDANFVAINCSGIGKEMLESELFGYKAGAFTGALKDKKGLFEMAHNGTIFLDEIGEMSIELQARILRALQNGSFIKLGDTKATTVDCRLIAATNVDLERAISRGTFREDLYYRISSFTIKIPTLSERDNDIDLLVDHFLDTLPQKLGLPRPRVTPSFLKALRSHYWKGNVRELINHIERAVILSSEELNADVLDIAPSKKGLATNSLESIELAHIKSVLEKCKGNKRETARKLGISIATLYRKLEE